MGAHHEFSPSQLMYREACPGWKTEEGEQSVQAAEGTMMHQALETGDLKGLNEEQSRCVNMVSELFAGMREELETEGPKAEVHQELRLGIMGLTFGTADLVLVNGTNAKIGDAKFGWNAVEDAETNLQGWAYAIGVYEKWPSVECVEVVFAQPRLDTVSRAQFYRKTDLERMRLRVMTVIARAKDHKPEDLRPSEFTCLYCGAKATCTALHKKALVISSKFVELTPDQQLLDIYNPEQLATPELRGKAEILRRILEPWCDKVRKENLRHVLETGEEIPGFEVKSRAGRRSVTDPQITWELVKDRLTPEEFAGVTEVSVAQLLKAYSDKAPRGAKEKLKQEIEDRLTDAGILQGGDEIRYLQRTKEKQNK
jgi:hypothetical protein